MINLDAIPEPLRTRAQFLHWDSDNDTPRRPHKNGDFTVSWSDPDEWLSFEDAVQQSLHSDSWGIGYVTAVNNKDYPMGMVSVIDLDDAADGSDDLADWVPSLEPFFERDCYLEWSPSHNEAGPSGIHIPVLGTDIPEWWSDSHIDGTHAGADLLANKFCTVTGDIVDGSGENLPTWDDWVVEWLAELYENLTGDDPLETAERETREQNWESDDGEWLDEETVAEALEYIDPNCSYSQWRDVGFGLADEFGEHTAERLFDGWSRGSSKYDEDAKRLVKDIVSRGRGGVTIGTVVYLAKEGGWEPSSHRTTAPPPSSVDNEPEPDKERATDGGETAAESAPTAGTGPEGPDGSESDPYADWAELRNMFRGADNADERATPRFEAAMKLHTELKFANLQENEVLYAYDADRGIFADNGKQVVRQYLTNGLEEQYRGHTMSEVMDQIRGRNTLSQREMGGPDGLIAARNCVIDLHEHTRRDHSAEYRFLSRLGCDFDPEATAPEWHSFLDDVVPGESERKKLQEFVGYALHHWDLPFHKALFLVGPTASGKSTFLDTVNELLGEGTVASLTPQQLTGERFGPAELFGKWANIRNDIPKSTVKNTGMFKELIAGDPMKAEKKNKDPFFFNPTAKHLFSANQLPEMEVDDEAFFRRILLVPFPETVPEGDRDKFLDEKLQAELPGILNWAIEGLQRLLGNGGFTGDRSPARTRETWSKWGDSVSRFAKYAITDGEDNISKSEMYSAFLEFCRQESIPSDTQHKMTRELKQEGFEDDRAYVNGSQKRVFTQVSWTGRGKELLAAAQAPTKSEGDSSPKRDRQPTGLKDFD